VNRVEKIRVRLQSGSALQIHAWPGSESAQPAIIVAPDSSPAYWSDFVSNLNKSHAVIFVEVSSAYELLMLIWEIGEPTLVLGEGLMAADWISQVLDIAPGAINATIICDGDVPTHRINTMHAVPFLILRGRQSTIQSHERAVQMHEQLRNSTLAEPEGCGNSLTRYNPEIAAAAINWFLTGTQVISNDFPHSSSTHTDT
tara:strand:- start:22172 stop:22771 length:600 start_codon:yes stop_codon:yes gene_type:complete